MICTSNLGSFRQAQRSTLPGASHQNVEFCALCHACLVGSFWINARFADLGSDVPHECVLEKFHPRKGDLLVADK